MPNQEKPVLLMLADISGYTRFMTDNSTSAIHTQIIITELMKSTLKQARIPLKISKLEGDAVFLFMETGKNSSKGEWLRENLHARMEMIVRAFNAKTAHLIMTNLCPCNACQNLEKLKLKIVLHCGTALFYRLDKFEELSGVDVILVHRLLKNSLPLHEYVLMSEAAYQSATIPAGLDIIEGTETYEEIGIVKTYHYIPATLPPTKNALTPSDNPISRLIRYLNHKWKMRLTGDYEHNLITPQHYNHLEIPESTNSK